jgi:hypothetical protein
MPVDGASVRHGIHVLDLLPTRLAPADIGKDLFSARQLPPALIGTNTTILLSKKKSAE